MDITVSQAFTTFEDGFAIFLSDINEATGATEGFAKWVAAMGRGLTAGFTSPFGPDKDTLIKNLGLPDDHVLEITKQVSMEVEELSGFQEDINFLMLQENELRQEKLDLIDQESAKLLKNLDYAGYGKDNEKDSAKLTEDRASATALLATSIAGATTKEAGLQKAMQITAVIAGATAILSQGQGDPYTAFARMAAMAVTVGSILTSSGISSGYGGVKGGAASASASSANTFAELNAVTDTYGAVDFDSFIDGLDKATQTLEAFGSIGTSITSQLDSITSQLSMFKTLSTSSADDIISWYYMKEYGIVAKVSGRSSYSESANAEADIASNIAYYTKELSKIVVETLSSTLDFGLFSTAELEAIIGDFDQESFSKTLKQINELALKAKQAGGVLTDADQAKLIELYSLPNFIKGQDYADAIDLITKAYEDSAKAIEGTIKSLQGVIASLRGSALSSSYTLGKYYSSMSETLALDPTSDAFKTSLNKTIGLTGALGDSSNFASSAEQKFAKLVAAKQFEDLETKLEDELDVLKEISALNYETLKTAKATLSIERQILEEVSA